MLQASFDVAGRALLVCALIGLASSTGVSDAGLVCDLTFPAPGRETLRDRSPRPQPPVSVPQTGCMDSSPGLAQCLETFFRQDARNTSSCSALDIVTMVLGVW